MRRIHSDEVQQYIGTSVDRSVTITEIAEILFQQLDSQVMLVAAASALTVKNFWPRARPIPDPCPALRTPTSRS